MTKIVMMTMTNVDDGDDDDDDAAADDDDDDVDDDDDDDDHDRSIYPSIYLSISFWVTLVSQGGTRGAPRGPREAQRSPTEATGIAGSIIHSMIRYKL